MIFELDGSSDGDSSGDLAILPPDILRRHQMLQDVYVTSLSQFETIFPIMTLDFRRPMAEPFCVLLQPSVTLCGNDCTYPRWSSFNFANTIPKDFCLALASPLGHIQKTMHQRNVYHSARPLSTVVRMASPDILTAETTSSAMTT